jgi:hypothetical protein
MTRVNTDKKEPAPDLADLAGAWVLDRILGTPPPKPTVDVEAVEPDIRGANRRNAKRAGMAPALSVIRSLTQR